MHATRQAALPRARAAALPHARPLAPAMRVQQRRCLAARAGSSSGPHEQQQDQQQQQQHQQQQGQQQHQQQQHHHQQQQRPQPAAAVALLAAAGAAAGAWPHAAAAAAAQPLHVLAELDAAGAHALESVLRPLFALFTVLYIIRIPMTWYPTIDGTKLPWLLAYAPTEPFLVPTRALIPLVGGVDISPIVWVGAISFANEILLGPQGLLMLIQRESGAGLL